MKPTPFIAELVMARYDHLSTPEKIRLLRELAIILPKAEAASAQQLAFLLQHSEEQQLAFKDVMSVFTAKK